MRGRRTRKGEQTNERPKGNAVALCPKRKQGDETNRFPFFPRATTWRARTTGNSFTAIFGARVTPKCVCVCSLHWNRGWGKRPWIRGWMNAGTACHSHGSGGERVGAFACFVPRAFGGTPIACSRLVRSGLFAALDYLACVFFILCWSFLLERDVQPVFVCFFVWLIFFSMWHATAALWSKKCRCLLLCLLSVFACFPARCFCFCQRRFRHAKPKCLSFFFCLFVCFSVQGESERKALPNRSLPFLVSVLTSLSPFWPWFVASCATP